MNKFLILIGVAFFVGFFTLLHGQKALVIPKEQLNDQVEIGINEALNNSEVINAFLIKSKGNRIQLPPGQFLIGSSIIIPSETTLSGSDEGSSIWIHKDFKPGIAYFLNESFNLGNTKNDHHIILEDLTIHGELHSSVAGNTMGVFFNKVNNSVIRSLTMYQIKNEAIRIHSSMPNVSAQNNVVEKCFINKRGLRSKGIMLSSYTNDPLNENKSPAVVNDFIVKESTIIGGDHGIILFNVKNGLIEGNQCIASVERGIILSPTVSNVIISENIVDSAGSTGIHLAYNAKDITIQKNRVTNSLMDMSGRGFEGQGIKAYAGFNNIRIIDNVCIGNATDGIALEGGGEGSNFLISGNLLENNKRNGIRVWAGEISICKGGDITFGTIGDNRIEGNLEEPIFIGSDNYGKNKVRKTKVLADNKLVPAKGKLKVKQEYSAPSNKVYRGS